jgi:chemotaxis protein methyltransferase WspC
LEIDAVDISARALSRARNGIYGKNSFRGGHLEFRGKHFQSSADGFTLDPSITKMVRFCEGNVLAEDFQPPNSLYDVIFCRNLLIYFDLATQHKALARIRDLLSFNGFLFVGAAEQALVLDKGFVSAHLPMAFACRKRSPLVDAETFDTALREEPTSPQLDSTSEGNSAASSATMQSVLEGAKRLADEGRLEEAARICEACLRDGKTSAQAYYLLGLVRDATGDPAAADFYRKALYLDPNHHDTLLQMALWSKKNGESSIARRFRNRAQRVSSNT